MKESDIIDRVIKRFQWELEDLEMSPQGDWASALSYTIAGFLKDSGHGLPIDKIERIFPNQFIDFQSFIVKMRDATLWKVSVQEEIKE